MPCPLRIPATWRGVKCGIAILSYLLRGPPMRTVWAVLVGLWCATAASAGEAGLDRKWKMSFFAPGAGEMTPWLLKITEKDGKLSGNLTTAEGFLPSALSSLSY